MHQRRGTSSRGRNGLRFLPSRKLPSPHAIERKMCQSIVQKIFHLKTFRHNVVIFTTRIRRMAEGTVFTGVSVHISGRGVPHPADGGTPILSDGGSGRGVPPSKIRMGGYHHPRSGWGVPPSQVRMEGSPQLEHHSMYLLCGGWYTSCAHAGGLSFLLTAYVV